MKFLRTRKPGFTLVELLVVIGIIALLISILLPSLNRARESAKRVKCLSNMRSVGQSLVLYINNNRTTTPCSTFQGGNKVDEFGLASTYDDWTFLNNNPVKGMNFYGGLIRENEGLIPALVCPTAVEFPGETYGDGVPVTSYLPNALFVNRKVTTVPGSAEYAVLQEDRSYFTTLYYRPQRGVAAGKTPFGNALLLPFSATDRYQTFANQPNNVNAQYSNVHNGGGNLLMLDGHAEFRKYLDVTARTFGLCGSKLATGGTGFTGLGTFTYEDDLASPRPRYASIFETEESNRK